MGISRGSAARGLELAADKWSSIHARFWTQVDRDRPAYAAVLTVVRVRSSWFERSVSSWRH